MRDDLKPNGGFALGADDVLRKIGRNLLLFQRIEGLLKHLVAGARLSGPAVELTQIHERQIAAIHKQTLGQLVGRFVDDILDPEPADDDAPVDVDEVRFSLNFSIDSDSEFVERHRSDLARVVADRNELIHHFLSGWNPASEQCTSEAIANLDAQRERALPVLEQLKSFVVSTNNGRKIAAQLLASDEVERAMQLAWLQTSPVVSMLGEIASQEARPDGFTDLAVAGQRLWRNAPQEMTVLKELYGHETLKPLLRASELFEVIDEPLPKGGSRTVYRPRPEAQPGSNALSQASGTSGCQSD